MEILFLVGFLLFVIIVFKKISKLKQQKRLNNFFNFAGIRYGDNIDKINKIIGNPYKVHDDNSVPSIANYYYWIEDEQDTGLTIRFDRKKRIIGSIDIHYQKTIKWLYNKGIVDNNLSYLGKHYNNIVSKLGTPINKDNDCYEYHLFIPGSDSYDGILTFSCYDFDDGICTYISVQWFQEDYMQSVASHYQEINLPINTSKLESQLSEAEERLEKSYRELEDYYENLDPEIKADILHDSLSELEVEQENNQNKIDLLKQEFDLLENQIDYLSEVIFQAKFDLLKSQLDSELSDSESIQRRIEIVLRVSNRFIEEKNRQQEQPQKKNQSSEIEVLWHTILNVSPNASSEEIKHAYRKSISEYHPDKVAQLGVELHELAKTKTQQINAAYQYAKSQGLISS